MRTKAASQLAQLSGHRKPRFPLYVENSHHPITRMVSPSRLSARGLKRIPPDAFPRSGIGILTAKRHQIPVHFRKQVGKAATVCTEFGQLTLRPDRV